MDALRFTLSGKNGFFKKPEVNSYVYFTYGNIHRIALMGIFGAILGYGGYSQVKDFMKKNRKKETLTESFPEFYEKLKNVKISILPSMDHYHGTIPKKIQTFNNSVGYASKEQGGNLIVREQWLENPKWDIVILMDSEEAEKIRDAICAKKCVYYPYLGKNDHMADIGNLWLGEVKEMEFDMGRLDCLVPADIADIADLDEDKREDLDACGTFKYQEALPWALDPWTNLYVMRTFFYTDDFIKLDHGQKVYVLPDGKKIIFY